MHRVNESVSKKVSSKPRVVFDLKMPPYHFQEEPQTSAELVRSREGKVDKSENLLGNLLSR